MTAITIATITATTEPAIAATKIIIKQSTQI